MDAIVIININKESNHAVEEQLVFLLVCSRLQINVNNQQLSNFWKIVKCRSYACLKVMKLLSYKRR
jgi:hypothetical protein